MLQITKQKKDVQVNEFVLLNLEQQKCMHLSLQGCHTPIKAKCFQNFSCAFILASKYNFYPTTTVHTDTATNILSKPQSQMQQSLLQKLHSIIGLSPKSKFASKPKDCSCFPSQAMPYLLILKTSKTFLCLR